MMNVGWAVCVSVGLSMCALVLDGCVCTVLDGVCSSVSDGECWMGSVRQCWIVYVCAPVWVICASVVVCVYVCISASVLGDLCDRVYHYWMVCLQLFASRQVLARKSRGCCHSSFCGDLAILLPGDYVVRVTVKDRQVQLCHFWSLVTAGSQIFLIFAEYKNLKILH